MQNRMLVSLLFLSCELKNGEAENSLHLTVAKYFERALEQLR